MDMSEDLTMDTLKVKQFVLLLNPELEVMENLDSYIAITLRKILNHCNLKNLPNELVEIAAEMLIDIILVNQSNSDTENNSSGEVKSIAEGDTTITFDFSDNNEYRKTLNKYFKNYTSHIAPFRKIRW